MIFISILSFILYCTRGRYYILGRGRTEAQIISFYCLPYTQCTFVILFYVRYFSFIKYFVLSLKKNDKTTILTSTIIFPKRFLQMMKQIKKVAWDKIWTVEWVQKFNHISSLIVVFEILDVWAGVLSC